ncbi:hypothetical protein ABW21_db0200198 [Orbilia brochopaga]|nr:hypothetical protein ABW21_db0200198 [Drechslerella brochopaga]
MEEEQAMREEQEGEEEGNELSGLIGSSTGRQVVPGTAEPYRVEGRNGPRRNLWHRIRNRLPGSGETVNNGLRAHGIFRAFREVAPELVDRTFNRVQGRLRGSRGTNKGWGKLGKGLVKRGTPDVPLDEQLGSKRAPEDQEGAIDENGHHGRFKA